MRDGWLGPPNPIVPPPGVPNALSDSRMRISEPGATPLPARAKMRVSDTLRPVWDSIGGQPWSVSCSVRQGIRKGPMHPLVSIVPLAILVALAGCASRYNEEELQRRFVGKSKAQLLSCAGAPTSQQSDGSQEFLTYSTQAYASYQGNLRTSSCRMNFTLTNGYVTNVTGSWFGPILNKSVACDRIVGAC